MAKERAGVPADEDVEVMTFPGRRSLLDAISDQFGALGAGGVWSLFGGPERRAAAALSAPIRLFRQGEPLALMPFSFLR
jgi:hypothetical protein